MRVDKFLKASRILKRRTVSKELALNDRVEINGRVVKPSHEVRPGDHITVTYGRRSMTVEVLSTEEVRRKRDTEDMYRVIAEERVLDSGDEK